MIEIPRDVYELLCFVFRGTFDVVLSWRSRFAGQDRNEEKYLLPARGSEKFPLYSQIEFVN
jgi:hypothetical protein